MDDALFPHYSEQGRDLIRKAYDVAEKALAGETRSNGTPFFGHPLAVAKIVSDEIGLPVSDNGLILPCGASARCIFK